MTVAALSFLVDKQLYKVEKPYQTVAIPDVPKELQSNLEYQQYDSVQVVDARADRAKFDLETNGFVWLDHQSQLTHDVRPFQGLGGDPDVVKLYLKETIDIVKQHTQAESVFAFDWRFRHSETRYSAADVVDNGALSRFQVHAPVSKVHCGIIKFDAYYRAVMTKADYSYDGGLNRLQMHMTPEELKSLTENEKKICIINAWRPFWTVESFPLALCDRQSVGEEELVMVDKVLPDTVEEEATIFYRDKHRWYYLSSQTADEIALFNQWQYNPSGYAFSGIFHAAMGGEQSRIGTQPRSSIEVRVIVIGKAIQ